MLSSALATRLYAILDITRTEQRGLDPLAVMDAWLDAGVRLVQLRAKTLASGPMLALADALAVRARDAGAVFIVNDRADIARMAGASGVHVGQGDLGPADVRRVVGAAAVVGLSTHTPSQLADAVGAAVDYVAVGPVFATSTKEHPDPVVGLDGVRAAAAVAATAGVPLVAIGGITLSRAPDVIRAGASAVAVVADLLAGDVDARAREFLSALGAARVG